MPLTKPRYHLQRLADRLGDAGFPLRRRALLVFRKESARLQGQPHEGAVAGSGRRVGTISEREFLELRWAASPSVRLEAADWRGPGIRVALAATCGNELEGFCWLETGTADVRFFDAELPLPAGTCYLSRLWIQPQRRGQHLGRLLLEHGVLVAAQKGHATTVSACVPANGRMLRLYSQLGWSFVRRVDYLRVGAPSLWILRSAEGTSWRLTSARRRNSAMQSLGARVLSPTNTLG